MRRLSLCRSHNGNRVPEFSACQAEFRVRGTTRLNIGKTAVNYYKSLKNREERRGSRMEQQNLTENVNSLFQSLEDFTQRWGIIGKPVSPGDKTFLRSFRLPWGMAAETHRLGKAAAGAGDGNGRTRNRNGSVRSRRQAMHGCRSGH